MTITWFGNIYRYIMTISLTDMLDMAIMVPAWGLPKGCGLAP